jgi:hypothetical protein
LSCALSAAPAVGQHCQAPSETAGELLHVALRAEAAHFDDDSVPGYYEGLSLRTAFELGIVRASAGLPYYRLLEVDGVKNGFGDLDSKLELSVLEGDDWSLGPALFASFPTGSAEKRLGMGHVMFGPSAWIRLSVSRAFLSGELGYEQALAAEDESGESAHAHHHGAAIDAGAAHRGPIPNPMNPEELWVGVNASYTVLASFEPYLGATVAVPTSEEGSTRATLRAGASFPVGVLVTSVGFELDVLGVIRREIAVASVGARY